MQTRKPGRNVLVVAVATALFSLSSMPLHAQQAPTSGPPDEESPATLDSITVTAQKREEALQDVPIMVTALSEQVMRDTGVRDVKDLQILVPGLTVSSTQSEVQTVARIRGIGTVGDNPGLESSVGVVIDGVYRPRNGVGFGDLGEIERIEVLKGPQGTVFGKNTSAGVINVVTRRPSYQTSVEGEITAGNYGALGVSGALNTAVGESAALRVYGAMRERDGFSDVRTGRGPRRETTDGDQNFHTLRGQVLFEPSETLDINISADFTSREENCCVGMTTVRGPTAAIINALVGGTGVAPVADPFARVAWSNRSTEQDIKDKGVAVELNWESPWFGGSTLTSITAQRDWQAINGLDFDFTSADLLYREADPDESFTGFETFSQEFRLTGSSDRLDWMVGAFYSDEDLTRNDSYRIGNAYAPYLSIAVLSRIAQQLAPLGINVNMANAGAFFGQASGGANFAGLGADDDYEQSSRSAALFTNTTFHATDALDLTVGLRYTRERKRLESLYDNPNGGAGCGSALANPAQVGAALAARGVPVQLLSTLVPQVIGFMCLPWANPLHDGRATNQERSEGEWSGTLKAAYRWNDRVMTYASAARGYKAGGFNLDRVQSSNGLSSGTAGIAPVADTSFPAEFVDSYELGAKTTWAGGNLLLNATLFHQTYSDFQLNSFLGTSFVVRSIPEVVSQGIDTEVLWQTGVDGLMLQGGLTYADTRYGDDLLPDADLSKLPGNRASFAPYWSGTAAVTYQFQFGSSLIGRFHMGGKYTSDYNTGSDLDAEKAQEAYTVVNARVGVGSSHKRWMLEAWALNLTDTEYKQVGFDAPLQAGSWNAFLGAPRTYGVTLRMKY
ncbi:TonB-dependent receptor [Montanilutibacter psychrotolerans]|uniref:TonB-dependent receptor n=1 Tax=Montanilutibacter psychrotolerans TaxID=1327343 RepID=A0A3M8SUV9_9GAMM|nr:TonB-dependent receptor [Lysobacter psychrotolerans]RNF85128.1 TonB-dependent receptor [Lysobacter psychrotolerans]